MLDELLLGGEVQETSKKNVLKAIAAQDLLQEVRLKYLLPSMFENFVLGKTTPMGYNCFFLGSLYVYFAGIYINTTFNRPFFFFFFFFFFLVVEKNHKLN
jgi:hypothetical protein